MGQSFRRGQCEKMCSVLANMATSNKTEITNSNNSSNDNATNIEDRETIIRTHSEISDDVSDKELSVGSPEPLEDLNESETTDNNLNSSSTNNISTAALRILRKRKNSEEENSSNTDTEKPLDFTNKKSSSNSEIQSSPLSQSVHNSYFLPYK